MIFCTQNPSQGRHLPTGPLFQRVSVYPWVDFLFPFFRYILRAAFLGGIFLCLRNGAQHLVGTVLLIVKGSLLKCCAAVLCRCFVYSRNHGFLGNVLFHKQRRSMLSPFSLALAARAKRPRLISSRLTVPSFSS